MPHLSLSLSSPLFENPEYKVIILRAFKKPGSNFPFYFVRFAWITRVSELAVRSFTK